jgi:hypothetical protein
MAKKPSTQAMGSRGSEPCRPDEFERRVEGLPESAKALLRFAKRRGII